MFQHRCRRHDRRARALWYCAAVAGATAWLAGCAPPAAPPPERPPGDLVSAPGHTGVVSAAHPAATQAGLAVLRAGGSAVDAAIAVQMVLAVVEPPETGLAGGGFLLHWSASDGVLEFYDGRETAPAAAEPGRFTWPWGRPLPHALAVVSGRAVGVPGLVAMLADAHEVHGRLAWPELLAAAIGLAREGSDMPVRLQTQLRADPTLRLFRDLRELYVRPLRAKAPRLRDAELADTLHKLAEHGPGALYAGALPAAIIERAGARRPWRGDLTADDFRAYQPERREALCGRYRDWRVCGAPPPSAGGLAVLQVLGMLEQFPMAELRDDRAHAVHLIAEASRLAFVDRARHVGDPAFVDVPVAGLLDPAYLAELASRIDPARAAPRRADAARDHSRGTSHFTVIDAAGNIAALTSSIEAPFGSRMRAAGLLLNNQLTDFDFHAQVGEHVTPNLPGPGKRPRSSMSPVIVFDADGGPILALGARGGSRIIGHVIRVLVATLDWELPLAEALAEGNFLHRGQGLELERESELADHSATLRAKGHRVRLVTLPSGLHGIERTPAGWRGAADPRLDGAAQSLEHDAIMSP